MARRSEWHGPPPKDGAWREVTLAYMRDCEERLWLRCSPCGHERFVEAEAGEVGLDLQTPLLAISWRLRCSLCGERKAHCLGEPHGMSYWVKVRDGPGGAGVAD